MLSLESICLLAPRSYIGKNITMMDICTIYCTDAYIIVTLTRCMCYLLDRFTVTLTSVPSTLLVDRDTD